MRLSKVVGTVVKVGLVWIAGVILGAMLTLHEVRRHPCTWLCGHDICPPCPEYPGEPPGTFVLPAKGLDETPTEGG